jgi:hypothetical protein
MNASHEHETLFISDSSHAWQCMYAVDMWGSGGLTSAVGWKNGICQGGGDIDRSTTLLLEGCS